MRELVSLVLALVALASAAVAQPFILFRIPVGFEGIGYLYWVAFLVSVVAAGFAFVGGIAQLGKSKSAIPRFTIGIAALALLALANSYRLT